MKRLRRYFAEKVSQARNAIYTRGAPIKGGLVESLLKPFSLVPTIVSLIVFYALNAITQHPFRTVL